MSESTTYVERWGSWLSGQAYNLQLIGKALNHSSVSSTQIYSRLDINPLGEALERNARLVFGGDTQSGKSPSERFRSTYQLEFLHASWP